MFISDFSKEEWKRFLLLLLVGGFVVLVGEKFLFPWLRQTSAVAHCYSYFGINGAALMLGGVVVIAVGLALVFCVFAFVQSLRAVRHRQFPPPGRYFIQPRRFKYGGVAVARGYIGMALTGLVIPAALFYTSYGVVPFILTAADLATGQAECANLTGR